MLFPLKICPWLLKSAIPQKVLRKKVPLNSPQKSFKPHHPSYRLGLQKYTVLGDIQGKSIHYNNYLVDLQNIIELLLLQNSLYKT